MKDTAAKGLSVAVAGGGLAGLAAGCALAELGFHVILHERRPYVGGRASSYQRFAFSAGLHVGSSVTSTRRPDQSCSRTRSAPRGTRRRDGPIHTGARTIFPEESWPPPRCCR